MSFKTVVSSIIVYASIAHGFCPRQTALSPFPLCRSLTPSLENTVPGKPLSILSEVVHNRRTFFSLDGKKAARAGGNARGGKNAAPREKKVKDDVIEVEGRVVESLPNAMFRVEMPGMDQAILATISGRIRKNFVKILVGDEVTVELSPYDLTRGRITFRKR
eukprot:CAMPEP_0113297060 /NCGR_PEP_ID=MMETSP0010_2-20120614/82_1 /TAXON_ID=216773 ORGANISM="Corethron hystrix, Strain 308" /NCGR_SAMPLE_ID=MMETSP0010_2 /ASSEMBLY_ACC=CAM_ASM_000155 /LENGTH=161 /DNA_ID=CAMNT_0000149891 /DNA_START=136 /DNA_END=621 /DNA_ORIENTATION=+ /assembly_acc=CAM_ASM_000155